jgi:hypothetical protein
MNCKYYKALCCLYYFYHLYHYQLGSSTTFGLFDRIKRVTQRTMNTTANAPTIGSDDHESAVV